MPAKLIRKSFLKNLVKKLTRFRRISGDRMVELPNCLGPTAAISIRQQKSAEKIPAIKKSDSRDEAGKAVRCVDSAAEHDLS